MTARPGGRSPKAGALGAGVIPALLALLALSLAVLPIETPDVWYHLAAGRLMVATGHWPFVNTFSFTAPDYPWIDLHWMFQLLLYGAYLLGGANGCIALAALLVVATAGVVYAVTRRYATPAAAALLVAVALAVASPRFVPRPELLSFLLIAVYLALLDAYPRTGKALYLLVPLQILWTNAQGIFTLGLALIGCYWAGATLALLPLPAGWREESGMDRGAWRRLTLVLALATAGCVVNPYGIAGALFPLRLFGTVAGGAFVSRRIAEFQSPFSAAFAPLVVDAWMVLMVAAAGSFALNLRRWHLGRVLAVAAFGYVGSLAIRNMALSAWLAAPAIAANLAGWHAGRRATPPATRAERRRREQRGAGSDHVGVRGRRRALPAAHAGVDPGPGGIDPPAGATSHAGMRRRARELAAAAVLLALLGSVVTNHFWSVLGIQREFGLGVSGLRFSEQALAFAKDVGIGGRPFNCLTLGGFLLWHVGPEEKVFVDGRLEAYPEAVFREYFRVMETPAAWQAVARARDFDYVLLYHRWGARQRLIRRLTEDEGWVLAYYDEVTALLVPGDAAHRAIRERAARAFATVLAARRAAAPPPRRGWRDALRVPIIERERLRTYGEFLQGIEHYEEAAEVYARLLALDPDAEP
jgi:hypothetical protein